MDQIDFKILNIIFKFNIEFHKYPRTYEIARYFDESYISQQFIRNRINKLVKRKILIKLNDKSFKPNISSDSIK